MYKNINLIIILIAFITIFASNRTSAQDYSTRDSIFLFNNNGNFVFSYTIKQGNTLYGISKEFNTTIDKLYIANPRLYKNPIKPDEEILIPVSNESIIAEKRNHRKSKTPAFYYKVQPKETLYRISKIYFNKDIDDIVSINNIKNKSISDGQILKIGYWNKNHEIANIATKMRDEVSKESTAQVNNDNKKEKIKFDKIVSKPNTSKKTTEINSENKNEDVITEKNHHVDNHELITQDSAYIADSEKLKTIHRDSGIALWNKDSHIKGIYVLSNEAALNSMIEITNPMLQRKIFAKVIGNIPTNTYPDNIKVVLSPDAAMSLGALVQNSMLKLII
ncbi:MAG: LysM peptidoglycan-binding domain-containing protein [Saprospiraceae bacterium]